MLIDQPTTGEENSLIEQPPQPVQNPLTMVMKAKSPEDYAALQRLIAHFQSLPPEQNPVTIALNSTRKQCSQRSVA